MRLSWWVLAEPKASTSCLCSRPWSHAVVLRDLPDVLAIVKANDKIKYMRALRLFTPQPVLGSRTYLLHSVLHHEDGVDARRILKQVEGAMKKGHSRLLVCDVVLPPTGATLYQTVIDISLLDLLAAK